LTPVASSAVDLQHTAPAPLAAAVVSDRARAFWELTKPGITRMVMLTAAAGFCLAARPIDWLLLLHTMIGVALAAGGTNALNQWVERSADAHMRRTAGRPLPSGRLGVNEALVFSAGIASVGIIYLLVLVNALTAVLVSLSLTSYVFVYTPLKRRTWLATLVGAVPGALPVLAGWTAAGGGIDRFGIVLFMILFLWQMPHFYALAWIYRDDYRRGGFQMLTVVDPSGRRAARQAVLYTVALLALSLLPGLLGLAGGVYLAGAIAFGLTLLAASLPLLRERSDRQAWRLFFGSVAYLPLLFILMVADRI